MNPPDDWELLDDYAATGSHAAFDALVKRHAGWIYSTARRRIASPDTADDVTQATFIVLARKARSINRRESLSAWLYRVVNYVALDALRRQATRRRHEQLAARKEAAMPADVQPKAIDRYLDTALNSLDRRDREAVILRYFNDQTLEQIGRAQRVAASTVQRRIERSLARIGYQLKREGVVAAPAVVGATLAAIGTCSAPSSATAGLTALAKAAGGLPVNTAGPIGLANGAIKTMTIIKLKLAAAAVIAFSIVGGGGVIITHALAQPVTRTETTPLPTRPAPTPSALAGAGSTSDADFAKQFKSDWRSINLNITHVNPAVPEINGQRDSQSMGIQADLTILDTSHVLGVDRFNQMVVTRIVDDAGDDVTSLASAPNPTMMAWYTPLSYTQKFDQAAHEFKEVLGPQQFQAGLNVDPHLSGRLKLIEGYITVLTYDHAEHVDVPFVANGPPVEIVPGVKVHFASAIHNATSYNYEMAEEGQADSHGFDGQLRAGQALPKRMIAAKSWVDSAGNPIGRQSRERGNFDSGLAENGSGGMADCDKIAAMRFEIAVGLKERRVPITLKNIDVPHLTVASIMLPTVAATLSPLEQTEQQLVARLKEEREGAATNGWTDAKDQHVRDLWKAFVADSNAGTAVKVVLDDVMGLIADVKSYDEYAGTYLIVSPQMTIQRTGEPPTTVPTAAATMSIHIQKDDHGRLTLMISDGKNVPLAGRDGALFGVVDPLFVPSDPLDPKSPPKLAGLWIIRSAGKTSLLMDNGRPMQPMPMERIAATTKP